MPPQLLLALAIAFEVAATTSLKLSEGFTRIVPSVIVVVGYATAFVLLSAALAGGMALGVAYAIWAAVGVALVAVIGAALFHESLTWVQVGGIGLVIGGVVALELGGAH
jgi:small multidrug resistance pump